MKFARIVEGVAVDVVTGDPADHYPPVLANAFAAVPEMVEAGWSVFEGEWSGPDPQEPPALQPLRRTILTPPEFLLLLTAPERVAIRAARQTDPVIADWLAILDDPRLSEVDVTRQSTRDGLDYLAVQGLITPERADEIATGAPL